jgi:hypothetical protein
MTVEGGNPMAYAWVHDLASSWADYEQVATALAWPAASGLVLHLAGPTDEGVRIIDLWVSEAAGEHFRVERLVPVLTALGGGLTPRLTMRALRPEHLFVARGAVAPAGLVGTDRSG